MTPTGFSIAILSIGALAILMKNSIAFSLSAALSGCLGCGLLDSTGKSLSSGW